MKNLLTVLLLFIATICSAQVVLEVSQDGKYRPKEKIPVKWKKTEIVADEVAIKYINKFQKAISNPDQAILVNQSEETLRLIPVFKKLVEEKESFVVYDEYNKTINYFTETEKRQESSYLILLSITAVLLVVISNVLFKRKRKYGAAFMVVYIAAILSATLTFLFSALNSFIASAILIFFAALVFIEIINFKTRAIIFSIFIATHIFLLFV